METYYKNKTQDWYKKVTVYNTDPYPNQDTFTQERLDRLVEKYPDGKTPKNTIVNATNKIKTSLNDKIEDLLVWADIDLIDITSHIVDDKITGIINYKINNQHLQKRF